jgi:hypothetical protein
MTQKQTMSYFFAPCRRKTFFLVPQATTNVYILLKSDKKADSLNTKYHEKRQQLAGSKPLKKYCYVLM